MVFQKIVWFYCFFNVDKLDFFNNCNDFAEIIQIGLYDGLTVILHKL